MKKYLENLAPELKELIEICSKAAERCGVKLYLVGGFVRDLILGVENFDLDIVVEGDGIKFAEFLSKRLEAKKLTCHPRFGTATIVLGGGLKLDIATARQECYPQAACLPEVHSGSVMDDLKRRDFTINAMALSLNKNDYGSLLDSFGGLSDLRRKRIRVLHDLSFIDDPTRILRAVRFEKRFNFRIEARTLARLKEAVKLKMLQRVQPQRLRDELILILKEARPFRQVARVQALAGLHFIHPRLALAASNLRLMRLAGREIIAFREDYAHCRHLDCWLIHFMALLDELKIEDIKAIAKLFVFRKGETKRMLSYKAIALHTARFLNKNNVSPSAAYRLLDALSFEVIVLMGAKYKGKNLARHIRDYLQFYHSTRISVTGNDLRNLGIKQGPTYQKILRKVFDAKLDGKVHTKDDELEFIKKL